MDTLTIAAPADVLTWAPETPLVALSQLLS